MYNHKYFITILISCFCMLSCSHQKTERMANIETYALRLKPGSDLKRSIQAFINEKNVEAAWVVTCAGSLTNYQLRFANQQEADSGTGHFEIVGLSGTLSKNGSHIHLSVSDSTGKTIGGHLMEGCIVYTTAELIIQSSDKMVFKREKDGTTPWDELQIEEK